MLEHHAGELDASTPPDIPLESLFYTFGRLEQKIESIRKELHEIKNEQKRLADYIDAQKAGFNVLVGISSLLGFIVIFFKDTILNFFFGKSH